MKIEGVFLSAAGFGEDDGLLLESASAALRPNSAGSLEAAWQRGEKRITFGVGLNRLGESVELQELVPLGSKFGKVLRC